MRPPLALALVLSIALPAHRTDAREVQYVRSEGLRAELVVRGLRSPVFVTAPAGDPRLFVLEQPGRIRVVRDGKLLERPFLDLTDRVGFGGERGLLGLAFHPLFARNGFFFVNYTDKDGDTQIVRFKAGPLSDVADRASASPVLTVEQPYANHNGGMIAFAPDGMLWVGMGDGGAGGDPHGNGQDPATLLGKMLRLDVDHPPYTVPADNPFVQRSGARAEIWATGLRNPWRFSFDRGAPYVYVADVGQNAWEEVNVAKVTDAGLDYGWNAREGLHAFRAPPLHRGTTDPVLEYGHSEGCSVTGGYVYRGRAMPALAGTYFFADYCRGWIRSFRWSEGRVSDRREWNVGPLGSITSFGEDATGELYVTSDDGTVHRLASAPPAKPRARAGSRR
ncbi:MAG: PQQ-dependent sugar dehydrogenase [Candidatus Eisenbacteria bacterium]|uniref:PQQ-dependent sugar dehydrogenase n=1 Tax=Eiseniibacteriota bacterium TaxID=2212470 RepID=A0A933SBP2_UNCEI|nr:PQQ-dependent sugar dehydrogenase [Candidatus Eisenbacteria bacterium]